MILSVKKRSVGLFVLSRDHQLSQVLSKYPKQEEKKRRREIWNSGRAATIKELAHARLEYVVYHTTPSLATRPYSVLVYYI